MRVLDVRLFASLGGQDRGSHDDHIMLLSDQVITIPGYIGHAVA
jgi:hypothetical protein